MQLCTIFLRSETARMRALARSFAEHHPGSRATALLLDGSASELEATEHVQLIDRSELDIPDGEVTAALLDTEPLRSALIPSLLELMLEQDEITVYADPNIRIYSELDVLGEEAERHGWVLLPTLASPPAAVDGLPPADLFGSLGAFDTALLVASPVAGVRSALRWWTEQATRAPAPTSADPPLAISWWWDFEEAGIDHDPRADVRGPHWLDLAAGVSGDFAVVRDSGVCAGPRGFAGLEITEEDGAYSADGDPLRCFNFRGYSPAEPFRLAGDELEGQAPAIQRLCREYGNEIEELGDEELRGTPYGLSEMPDGTLLDGRMRKLYWEALRSGAVRESVFTESGNRDFIGWVREPGLPAGPPVLNRFVLQIYKERPDLQRAMAHTDTDFAERLGSWVKASAAAEIAFPDQVIPDALRPILEGEGTNGEGTGSPPSRPRWSEELAPSLLTPADTWGVNVVGFMRSDFGIAHAARLVIEAFDAERIPLLPIHDMRLRRFDTEGSAIATLGAEAGQFPITLVVMNGDEIPKLRARLGDGLFTGHYVIALWFWETDRIPEDWMQCFEVVDEVWVASDYVAAAVGRRASVPIHKIHLPVHVPPVPPTDRSELGIPESDYLFMYAFDYGSVGGRKNPAGLVKAFRQAFKPGEGASLLLKSSYSFASRQEYAAVRAAAEGHPDIRMLDERLPTDGKNALIAACDCYVSLHRSEGFGLSQAEAMYLGKPVIMTRYGGVLEFANDDNSFLVGYDEVEVGPSRFPYGEHDLWAEPRVEEAAGLMRHVFERREEAREVGERAARDIRSTLSAEAAGKTMEERLVRIRRMVRAEIPAGGDPSPARPDGNPDGAKPRPIDRLRAKLRIRTRLRALRGREAPIQKVETAGPPESDLAVWQREQELRLAALSAQVLAQLREIDRRTSRSPQEPDGED
jgi:glycosyltransferase involved in cell wall biosynthesis